jgi:hypothetical protein
MSAGSASRANSVKVITAKVRMKTEGTSTGGTEEVPQRFTEEDLPDEIFDSKADFALRSDSKARGNLL